MTKVRIGEKMLTSCASALHNSFRFEILPRHVCSERKKAPLSVKHVQSYKAPYSHRFSMASVRYIKILTRLRGFLVIFLIFLHLVWFSKSLLGIARQRSLEKCAIFTLKPRSHGRILTYRTWAFRPIIQRILHDGAKI